MTKRGLRWRLMITGAFAAAPVTSPTCLFRSWVVKERLGSSNIHVSHFINDFHCCKEWGVGGPSPYGTKTVDHPSSSRPRAQRGGSDPGDEGGGGSGSPRRFAPRDDGVVPRREAPVTPMSLRNKDGATSETPGALPDRQAEARSRPVAPLPDQPGTRGEHQKAAIGATGAMRQDRPFLKEASNASARPARNTRLKQSNVANRR